MSTPPLRRLTEQQVDAFRLNGQITVEDALSPDEVDTLAARADLIAAGEASHIPRPASSSRRSFATGTSR